MHKIFRRITIKRAFCGILVLDIQLFEEITNKSNLLIKMVSYTMLKKPSFVRN